MSYSAQVSPASVECAFHRPRTNARLRFERKPYPPQGGGAVPLKRATRLAPSRPSISRSTPAPLRGLGVRSRSNYRAQRPVPVYPVGRYSDPSLSQPSPAPSVPLHPPPTRWVLQRTFAVDVLRCPTCGGRRHRVATLTDPLVARRILKHLRLRAEPPPLAPARPEPQLRFA